VRFAELNALDLLPQIGDRVNCPIIMHRMTRSQQLYFEQYGRPASERAFRQLKMNLFINVGGRDMRFEEMDVLMDQVDTSTEITTDDRYPSL
jgi:hypothetical protein